jgi:hypothetical protein
MGELRIKAQELLKSKQKEKEYKYIEDSLTEEKNIEEKKIKSMKKFTEKIQKQINDFQKNLLMSSQSGETLKIDIVKLDSDNLVSWWDEREDNINRTFYKEYAPIKSEIITFIDDINLNLLTDDIILDKTLQELYDTIVSNDIYPQWRVKKSPKGEMLTLYLEANPLVSYKDRKDALAKEREIKERALVVVEQSGDSDIERKEGSRVWKFISFSFIFISVLYFSVAILTLFSGAFGLTSPPRNSFTEVAWPYFLSTDFSNIGELFIFSLPLGVLISIYFAYTKS